MSNESKGDGETGFTEGAKVIFSSDFVDLENNITIQAGQRGTVSFKASVLECTKRVYDYEVEVVFEKEKTIRARHVGYEYLEVAPNPTSNDT